MTYDFVLGTDASDFIVHQGPTNDHDILKYNKNKRDYQRPNIIVFIKNVDDK